MQKFRKISLYKRENFLSMILGWQAATAQLATTAGWSLIPEITPTLETI